VSWSAPIGSGLSLALADEARRLGPVVGAGYPTARLRRGLLLFDDGVDLSEEGVGFGVPVVKRGRETVFASAVELTDLSARSRPRLVAVYTLDLVERLRGDGGTVSSRALYRAKDALAALHRRTPALRGPLTAASSLLRAGLGWTTVYEPGRPAGRVAVDCRIDPDRGVLTVEVDLTGLAPDVDEAVAMNEQGARCFDRYREGDGPVVDSGHTAHRGVVRARRDASARATWDVVHEPRAAFVSAARGVAFWAVRADGARLYRGREVVGGRLAWAGFGYVAPPTLGHLRYEIVVERLPAAREIAVDAPVGSSRRGPST